MTREQLLEICEAAFLPQEKWRNRDTASAQRQLGTCYALLKAGSDFVVRQEEKVLTVTFWYHGWNWFEYGNEASQEMDRFYVPAPEHLAEVAGRDWYC